MTVPAVRRESTEEVAIKGEKASENFAAWAVTCFVSYMAYLLRGNVFEEANPLFDYMVTFMYVTVLLGFCKKLLIPFVME